MRTQGDRCSGQWVRNAAPAAKWRIEVYRLHRLARVRPGDKANAMTIRAELPRRGQGRAEMASASPRCHQNIVGHGFTPWAGVRGCGSTAT
jgi:hypothetical protein